MPYRIATPPDPIRTEEADTYEQTLVKERTRERVIGGFLVVTGIAVAAMAGTTVSNLSHRNAHEAEAKARVDARVDHARVVIESASREAEQAQEQFERAITYELLTNWSATLPVTPCSVEVVPGLDTAERPARRGSFPLLVAAGPGDRDLPSPSVSRLLRDVQYARELIATGHGAEALIYADALAVSPPSERLVRDVVLVPRKRVAPTRTSPTSFTPGVVEGTAYLYDFRQRAVVCVGDVHASSSRALEYSYNDGTFAIPKKWENQEPRLDATLDGDLDTQLARAILAPGTLRAITR